MNHRLFIGALPLALLTACSWVKLNPNAQQVQILTNSEVANCERLAATKVNTKTKIGFFNRNKEKYTSELQILARNEAQSMNANAVVAESTIIDGRQTYAIYRCP